MQHILERFPKRRSVLPDAYKKIYDEHYKNNRSGSTKASSLSQRLEQWMHIKVAKDVTDMETNPATLEIGAGNLNHLAYEPQIQDYDVVEPYSELLESSTYLHKIRDNYTDIRDIPAERKYERIIAIACFEHLTELPFIVSKAALHLSEKGVMRIAIPNEGTLLWRLGTEFTGFEFRRKYGLDYQLLMRHEHVNTAKEIEAVLKYFFGQVNCNVLGLNRLLAFYRFYECRVPDLERIQDYLK